MEIQDRRENIHKKRGKERQTFVYLFTGVHCNGGKN